MRRARSGNAKPLALWEEQLSNVAGGLGLGGQTGLPDEGTPLGSLSGIPIGSGPGGAVDPNILPPGGPPTLLPTGEGSSVIPPGDNPGPTPFTNTNGLLPFIPGGTGTVPNLNGMAGTPPPSPIGPGLPGGGVVVNQDPSGTPFNPGPPDGTPSFVQDIDGFGGGSRDFFAYEQPFRGGVVVSITDSQGEGTEADTPGPGGASIG